MLGDFLKPNFFFIKVCFYKWKGTFLKKISAPTSLDFPRLTKLSQFYIIF